MCFSAEASFAVGAPLIPAGMYCLWAAAVKKPSYVGLAAVPLFFGIQQISEGFVWHALEHGDSAQVQVSSLVFLFFALAFWPFWFPFLATLIEPQPIRKWSFAFLTLLATGWFWVLYYPLLIDPNQMTIQQVHHSIQYSYDDLTIYEYVPKTPLRVLYFLSIALPPLFGSENWGRLPGLVLGASALFSALVFSHAFVSVWCFFAAAMSIYCCLIFYRLPNPATVESESDRAESTRF